MTDVALEAAGRDPVTEGVPFQDISLVLLFSGQKYKRLDSWVTRFAADPDLCRSPVVILHHDCDPDLLRLVTATLPAVRLVALPNGEAPDPAERAQAYARAFEELTTPWFAITTVPARFGRYVDSLKHQVGRGYARVQEIELVSDRSILLHTRHRRKTAPRAYVSSTLSRLGDELSPQLRDYLGYLTLSSGFLKLEGVDPRFDTNELELFARVSGGRFQGVGKPPWNYRFAVVGTSGLVHAEAPGELQQRLDNQGGRRWENLIGRIRVADLPEGNLRFMVGVDTPYAALRSLRSLHPRAGVLAPARTVLLRSAEREGPPVTTRYLMHTVRRGTQSWITLQRGKGRAARNRWQWSMLKKDARQIVAGQAGRRIRLARLARLATLPYYRGKSIWLVGERADTAQDNGYHLFRHLRQNHPERRVYYIIDKDSPQYPRVRDLGNVVNHSSLHHQLLMVHASVLANAYSIKHMIPRKWHPRSYTLHLAWRVGAFRVYLKHGVHVSPNAVKRGTGGYDLYLSVNPMEGQALRESSGYRDQIVQTGMPRYDTLVPAPPSRTILFMPTWRRYFVPKLFGQATEAQVPFEGSTYEQFIRGLLTSPRLHEILTRYDYRLQLLPHYNLRQELGRFELTSDRTEFADTNSQSFQDLIRGCDAFVTDYSSVHFDVAYLGTPIIYTHFDREEYEAGHAVVSWFDHERDGFGPVVHTLDETLDALERLLARGCTQDPAYAARVDEAFTFHDHNNCRRVVTAIDEMVAAAGTDR